MPTEHHDRPPRSSGVQDNPLGDPRAFRGYSTSLKKIMQPEKKSDFLPSFSKSFGIFVVEVAKILIIAYIIIKPIHAFVIQPFYVKGASMEPTFHNNEYLIIDELSYRFHSPRRGDVIVLRNPYQREEFLIKRIIGLPGERVTITGGRVLVRPSDRLDGAYLDERVYLPASVETVGPADVVLDADQYFVLGDNRPASLDSRSFGPIYRSQIIGRTALRAWPLSQAKTFPTPPIGLRPQVST